jgi:hypothetical protein
MRIRFLLRLVLCMACWLGPLLGGASAGLAQVPGATESAVKAAFLFKFAAFAEWPPGTFQRPDQPLVIAVSGDDEVAGDLEQLASGRTIEGRPVSVRRAANGAAATGAHILFLAARRESRLREALESVAGPVLVVTEQPGALGWGSVINFMPDGGRVRFAASLASADARNVKLSARLLAVAQLIEGRSR